MNVKVMGLVVAGGIALAAAQASAVELVRYSFTGANASGGGTAGAPDSAGVNGTASTFTPAAGINTPSGVATNNFQADGFANAGFDAADYVTFTFTPSAGINFTSLTFNTTREASGSPTEYRVRSSRDSYAADIYSKTTSVTTLEGNSVSLAGASFQNVAASTAVVFRIYGFGASSSTGDWDLDDVVLNGELSGGVPEPAALGLVALGATALIRRRRA